MEEEGSTFGAGSSTDSDRGDCAREELVAALNDWVRRTSLTSCQLQEANMVRLRSQTQVMSARERETAVHIASAQINVSPTSCRTIATVGISKGSLVAKRFTNFE